MILPLHTLIEACTIGLLLGYFFTPQLIEFLCRRTGFGQHDASVMYERLRLIEARRIKRSREYKKRFNQIIKLIKLHSGDNKDHIECLNIEGCRVDKQIRNELERRGFSVHFREKNLLIIRWR